jgi:hypothetical protein
MRRRVVVILVFLLAGALVNVGVAWIVAAAIEPDRALMTAEPSRGLTAADHPRWKVTVGTALGSTLVGSSATREPPPRGNLPANATQQEIDAWMRGQAVREPRDIVEVPSWSRAARPPTAGDYESPQLWEDARGWPMRSLAAFVGEGGTFRAGLRIGGTAGALGFPRGLPLKPLWPGFAANTVLYAAILWLLIPGPFALRRLIRRGRGRCPACGYDLKHAAHESCPECGAGSSSPTGSS